MNSRVSCDPLGLRPLGGRLALPLQEAGGLAHRRSTLHRHGVADGPAPSAPASAPRAAPGARACSRWASPSRTAERGASSGRAPAAPPGFRCAGGGSPPARRRARCPTRPPATRAPPCRGCSGRGSARSRSRTNAMPPLMPAPKFRPVGPSTTTTPPVMYSQPWSPTPSTTAEAPLLRTAKRSPARPRGIELAAGRAVEHRVPDDDVLLGREAGAGRRADDDPSAGEALARRSRWRRPPARASPRRRGTRRSSARPSPGAAPGCCRRGGPRRRAPGRSPRRASPPPRGGRS